MHNSLRYYLDEDIEGAVGPQLRRRGVDVVSTHELGRAGRPFADSDQLIFAASEGRVLVTHDRDFIALAAELTPHAGVILLQQPLSIGEIIDYLELTSRLTSAEEMKDQLQFCDW